MVRTAVIGAGMGALATAARLAAGGCRVAVYERSTTYGGCVGRYERDGFRFDTGPGLLHLPAVYRDLFIKTGRRTLEQSVGLVPVDPAARHVFPDGTALSLPDASRAGVVAALDQAFGAGAGERWSDVLTKARAVWEATRRPLLEEVLPADPARLRQDPYPARPVRRGLLRRGGAPTLAEVAARELRDPRAAALLEQYAWAYGLDPATAPASAAVLAYLEQTFGTWYVTGGGIRALAEAVYERCRERGVEFHFGTEVVRVLEKDGRAAGVELADGTVAAADAVVCGAPPRRPAPPGSLSRFTVLLALRGAREPDAVHRSVVHGDRPVTVLRPDDPALRPDDGHEAVTLTVTVPPQGGPVDWTAEGVAHEYADQVVSAAEAAVPALAERLLWRVVRTPADLERETGAPGGAVPGPTLAGADGRFLRRPNHAPLPGLYHVGGHAHPGGGLPHTGMSGAIVADLITGGPGGSR